jgi:hypothetical protein
MGYDAVLPGGSDFAAGLSFLKGKEGAEIPFTCLNLVLAEGGRAIFPRFRPITRGGKRILVVGVLGKDSFAPDALTGPGWSLLPAREALADFLKGGEAKAADLIVVLSRLSAGENLAVARSSPVPVILLSPPSRPIAASAFAAGSVILQSREKGTHLLEGTVGSETGDLARAGFAEEGAAKRYGERRRALLAEMSAMDESRRALYRKTVESYDNAIREAVGKRAISYRWIPLDANIPDDPNVASMIEAYPRDSP